jgi:hypothetical protein
MVILMEDPSLVINNAYAASVKENLELDLFIKHRLTLLQGLQIYMETNSHPLIHSLIKFS